MTVSLLPPNSTDLERLTAEALAPIERVPVPLSVLWNPDTCPVDLLPYLAWAFSVDYWSTAWPDSAKRDAIHSAYFIHAHKGTIGSLRRVVEPLGFTMKLLEWWDVFPLGTPGTFTIDLDSSGLALDERTLELVAHLIDDAKPATRHLTTLAHRLTEQGPQYLGAALVTGEITTVIPLIATDLSAPNTLYSAAGMATGEITTIYPLGAFA
jgi:phage tail P2-like protein